MPHDSRDSFKARHHAQERGRIDTADARLDCRRVAARRLGYLPQEPSQPRWRMWIYAQGDVFKPVIAAVNGYAVAAGLKLRSSPTSGSFRRPPSSARSSAAGTSLQETA